MVCAAIAEAKCLICGPAGFVMNVGIISIIVSTISIVAFSLNLRERITFIHWPGIELLNSFIFFVVYFAGSCWLAANITFGYADTAAVIFGFATAAVYAASTWLALAECRQLSQIRYSPLQTNETLQS